MKLYTLFTKPMFGVIIYVLAAGCSSRETAIRSEPPVIVSVAKPVLFNEAGFMLSGHVEAGRTAAISTRIMGYIVKMNVKAGDHVRKGQLLFMISSDELHAKRSQIDAMIRQAEVQLQNAQKDYDRYTALFKQQSATAKEVDNIRLQYEAAKANLESSKQMRNEVDASFSYTSVTAPFDGIVTAKNADAGSLANPGAPILMLEGAADFRVAANIPETHIAAIKPGDAATVSLKSIERSFTGTITEINPSSQFNDGQYAVKISIPPAQYPGLYAGLYATISIKTKTMAASQNNSEKILIPVTALVQKDQLTGIYTPGQNSKAVLRWIRPGKQYGDLVEVLSGLDREESFIAKADGRLYNGAPVAVK